MSSTLRYLKEIRELGIYPPFIVARHPYRDEDTIYLFLAKWEIMHHEMVLYNSEDHHTVTIDTIIAREESK